MKLVLDTNILVGASFNPNSDSARILRAIERGAMEFVWNDATYRETRRIIMQIPPLDWNRLTWLFTPESRFEGAANPGDFEIIADPDDRKFAALAAAAGAVLVSNDDHVLSVRARLPITVLTPAEVVQQP